MKLLNIVLLFFGVLCLSNAATDFTKTPITEHGEMKILHYPPSVPTEASKNLAFCNLHALNVDVDGRLVGIVSGVFNNGFVDDPTTNIRTYTAKNATYIYIGDRLKIGEGKEVGKYWSIVAYVRATCLYNDENEIYYAAPEEIMNWHTVPACDEKETAYYLDPFLAPRIDISFQGKNDASPTTIVSHETCGEKCGISDWIANHGIYRMYDTRRFKTEKRPVGYESMQLLYYSPIQYIGSYIT